MTLEYQNRRKFEKNPNKQLRAEPQGSIEEVKSKEKVKNPFEGEKLEEIAEKFERVVTAAKENLEKTPVEDRGVIYDRNKNTHESLETKMKSIASPSPEVKRLAQEKTSLRSMLSYRSVNRNESRQVFLALQEAGFSVWFDHQEMNVKPFDKKLVEDKRPSEGQRGIGFGQDFDSEIEQGVPKNGRGFLDITPDFFEKFDYVGGKEITAFLKESEQVYALWPETEEGQIPLQDQLGAFLEKKKQELLDLKNTFERDNDLDEEETDDEEETPRGLYSRGGFNPKKHFSREPKEDSSRDKTSKEYQEKVKNLENQIKSLKALGDESIRPITVKKKYLGNRTALGRYIAGHVKDYELPKEKTHEPNFEAIVNELKNTEKEKTSNAEVNPKDLISEMQRFRELIDQTEPTDERTIDQIQAFEEMEIVLDALIDPLSVSKRVDEMLGKNGEKKGIYVPYSGFEEENINVAMQKSLERLGFELSTASRETCNILPFDSEVPLTGQSFEFEIFKTKYNEYEVDAERAETIPLWFGTNVFDHLMEWSKSYEKNSPDLQKLVSQLARIQALVIEKEKDLAPDMIDNTMSYLMSRYLLVHAAKQRNDRVAERILAAE